MKLINPASKVISIFPVLFLILAGPVYAETKDKKGCEQAAWYIDEGNKFIESEPQKAEALGCWPESINARYNLGIPLYNQKNNAYAIVIGIEQYREKLPEADTDANGKIEIQELYNYIKPQVERIARRVYNNEQTPQLVAPNELVKQRLIER